MSNVRTYDFTIPAGGSTQVDAVGTFFRIRKSTGALSISGEFGEASDLVEGQGMEAISFRRLVVRNVSGSVNVGTLIVSDASFVDQSMSVSGSVGMVRGNPYAKGGESGIMNVLTFGVGPNGGPTSSFAAIKRVSSDILIRKLYVRAASAISVGPISDLEKYGATINTGGGTLQLSAPNSIAFSKTSLSIVNPGVITSCTASQIHRADLTQGFNAVPVYLPKLPYNGGASVAVIDLADSPILVSALGGGVYFYDETGSPATGNFSHFAFEYDKV